MQDDAQLPDGLSAAARERAEASLDALLTGLQGAEGKIHDSAIAAFYGRAYELASTEAFQERLREACEGQTIGGLTYDGGDGLTANCRCGAQPATTDLLPTASGHPAVSCRWSENP